MWSLIKLVIWIAGLLVVAYFIADYFGFEPNYNYVQESRAKCQEKVKQCGQELIEQGTKNAKCPGYLDCIDLKLILKKKN